MTGELGGYGMDRGRDREREREGWRDKYRGLKAVCGPGCVTAGCSAGQPASHRGKTNPISCNGVKGHCSLLQNCCGQLTEQEALN